MTYCESCGWIVDHEWHRMMVQLSKHLHLCHGLSRRLTAQQLGIREKFVRDHAESPPMEKNE